MNEGDDAAGRPVRRLVGRARELRLLEDGLTEARAGRGRVCLLVGEPGIGKSRLSDEAARVAAERGMLVSWGRCWESGGAPAYWPWLEVLGPLARAADPGLLATGLGPGAPLLAAIVPELAERLQTSSGNAGAGTTTAQSPVPSTPPAGAPEAERFHLWRAAGALVRAAAGGDGLLIVLEDLHAADEASLHLFHFLARESRSLRLCLVGTYRDVEAQLEPGIGELLVRIGREATVLPLPRLDAQASGELLTERAGAAAAPVAGRVFQSTQGNPLFIEEMARLLAEEGPAAMGPAAPGEGPLTVPLPLGVRGVIRQRLDRLPAEARPLLDLAAVAGDELDPDLLAAASGHSSADVRQTLAAATRAGVLADRAGRRRFSHALVREVLYQELDEPRRRELHGAVAGALSRQPTPAAAELFHHSIYGPAELLPQAVEQSVKAARSSLSLLAYEEAIAVLERALAGVRAAGDDPVVAALRAEVTLALAETRIRCGDSEGGRALCRDVAQLARRLGEPVLSARAALVYGEVFTFAVVDPVLVDLLEEALSLLPEGPSPWRVRLLARLAGALQPATSMEEPVRIAREAIAAARQLGDRRTLLEALSSGMAAMMDVVHPSERLPLNLEIEGLAQLEGDRACLLRTQARLALDHLGLGELGEADARIEAFETLARELRAPWVLWRAPLFRSLRAMMHGRFSEAEAFMEEALRIGQETRDPQVERCVALHREGFLRAAERPEAMRSHDLACRRVRAPIFSGATWQSIGSALVATRLEDHASAERHMSLIPTELCPPVDNVYVLFYFAEPLAFVGSEALAVRMLDLLERTSEQDVVLGMTQLGWDGPVTRLRALLEARLGRWTEAFALFSTAEARLVGLGARPYLARCRYEHARALLQAPAAHAPAESTRLALELLHAALADANELQMPGLVTLIERRLTAVEGATRQQPPARAVAADRPADGASVPPGAGDQTFSLNEEGEIWAVSHAGKTFRLKDSLGMRYLARLCRQPEVEVHVLELAGGRAASGDEIEGAAPDLGDAGELLDEDARRSYGRRLEDLRDELEEAQSFGDTGRATRAREEMELIASELARAVGLGGRSRRAGGAAERARSAVQRRIKNALGRIEEHDPALAAYLSRTVKTGNFCIFRPGRNAD